MPSEAEVGKRLKKAPETDKKKIEQVHGDIEDKKAGMRHQHRGAHSASYEYEAGLSCTAL